MKLIPFSPEHLRLDAALPFGVRDGSGTLLLHAGACIVNEEQLAYLRAKALFADEQEASEWRRKLGATMGVLLRRNSPLKSIAEAGPQDNVRDGSAVYDLTVPDQWESLSAMLDLALREAQPNAELIARGGLYAELWARQSGGFLAKEAAE